MSLQQVDVRELYKNDVNLKEGDVKALLEWVNVQPHLPNISELQAALFLHSCYYSNELAKTTIDVHFTVKTLCPDIFGNRRPKDPILQNAINSTLMYPLPNLTSKGETVVFIKIMDTNADLFNHAQVSKCFDMILSLHLHQHGPSNGIVVLYDMQGLTFSHFLKMNIVVVKKFVYYMQEGMPIRLKDIHYLNAVPFMDKILALLKPFMKKELYDSLISHSSLENLHNYLPKSILPQDYGGSCDSSTKLHEHYKKLLNENEEFFRFEETQQVDESQRPNKPKQINNIFGIEGTFKKLEVD